MFWFQAVVCIADPPLINSTETSLAVPSTVTVNSPFEISEADAKASMQWLASMVVQKMPRTYDGDKDWGNVKQVWSGVKIHREGFELKTHRRFRDVNHGRWIRYELSLPTSGNAATIDVNEVAKISDVSERSASPTGWRIRSTITAPMHFVAKIERWNLGLKWYSVSVSGNMLVRLRSASTVRFAGDYSIIPPAIMVDPHVEQAELTLESFEVERISKVGGDVAEAWGEIIQEVIRQRIRHKENATLADKLNRSIDKHRDDLRWSISDATTRWLDVSHEGIK